MANLKIDLIVDDKGSVTVNKVTDSFGKLDKAANDVNKTVAGTDSRLYSLHENWMAYSAAIASAGYVLKQVFEKGFTAVEQYNLSIASMAAMVTTFSEREEDMALSDQWEQALKYSTAIVPILENIAAKTLLSGQETTALANAFARSGVFLDAMNQKQVESFERISNALPLMTAGQDIMKQINTEIRSVMTGASEQSSIMLQTLKAVNPNIENNLKTWREEGTVLENIGELLIGFGPATALLENQWQAVKSTLDTTVTQVLRGGMFEAYEEIIKSTQGLNSLLEEHKIELQGGIQVTWGMVSNLVGAVKETLIPMGPMLKDMGAGVGVIAYGWGGVFAVLKPIGAFLGNSIGLTWELAKLLGNSALAIAALANRDMTLAGVAWDEAKKSASKVAEYSEKNRNILTQDIANAILQYDNQTQAALKGEQQKNDAADAGMKFKAKVNVKMTEEEKKLATKRQQAQEEIAKFLIKNTMSEIEQIEEKAREYEKLGIDRARVEEYAAAAIGKIEQKRAQEELKIWEKGQDNYEKIMGDQADFAATENQRAINKIISQERKQLLDLADEYTKGGITYQQYLAFLESSHANTQKAITAKEIENNRLQLEATKTLYDSIAGMESLSAAASILLLDNKLTKTLTEIGTALSEEEKAELKKRALAQGTTEILNAVNIARLADMKTYYDSVDALGAAGGLIDDQLLKLRTEKLKNTLMLMMGDEAGYAAYLGYLDTEQEKNWLAKNIKRESDIVSTIGNIKGYEKEAHDARIALIDLEAAKRVLEGQNAVNVEIWVRDEQKKAYVQMGLDGDSWVAGAEAQLIKLAGAYTTWGAAAGGVVAAFATDAKTQLSDNFFNIFKGNFDQIGADWDAMLDSMLKSLSKSLADMLVEAAAHDILLLFKSDWVEGGSNVLGIINKVIGIGADIIDWFSPGGGKAYGGLIPGAASGIDSLMNDTVPTMLSPGEYVLPASLVNAVMGKGRQGDTMLAHINPAEAAVLKMLGGSGTINPRTGLPEFFSVREGANAVDISGAYPFGAPMAGGIGPASILDTTAGTRYYVPLDLILGGAQSIQNTGYIDPRTGKSYGEGRWYYPAVPSDVSGLIGSLPMIDVPQDWINASVSGKWGGIDNPTRGFYLNADQYQALYGGMYQSPVPTYDPVNAVPIDWSNMHLKGGIYAGGGVDTWWELDPRTGTSTVYSQEGRNQSAASGMWAALSQLLFTIGGTMLGAPYLGAYLGTAGGMAAGAGMGAAAGAQATGQNLEDTLKSAAMAAAMAYIAGTITSPTAPSTSAAEIAEISAGESEAWGYAPTSSMEEIAAAMQEAGTMPSTFDKMLAKAEEYIARKAIKTGISAIMPGVDTGDLNTGQMKISYMGAQDGGLLSELSKMVKSMKGQEQFSFHASDGLDYVPRDNFPIRAHRGEAVLDAQEARDWRQAGGAGQLLKIEIILDSRVVAEQLVNISKRGVAVVHKKGITE